MLLDMEEVRVYYKSKGGLVRAVDGVDIRLEKEEILGLVGESGCGKSTLGLAIPKLLPKNAVLSGKILLNGLEISSMRDEELRRIRGEEIGFVFQDPMTSLNPVLKIEEHFKETISSHRKLDNNEIEELMREALEDVGVPYSKAKEYPHRLSGGQRQRVMIALALVLKPSLLIADEPTTSLDVITQAEILKLFLSLRDKYKTGVLLITHDLGIVSRISDRISVMYAGKIVEVGKSREIFEDPLHPYTKGLISCFPRGEEIGEIPGSPPDLRNPPTGCRFHPRCPMADDLCRREEPALSKRGDRLVACHFA